MFKEAAKQVTGKSASFSFVLLDPVILPGIGDFRKYRNPGVKRMD